MTEGRPERKQLKMSRPINYLVIEPDTKTHRMTVCKFLLRLDLKRRRKGKEEEKEERKSEESEACLLHWPRMTEAVRMFQIGHSCKC
jgi:hypothetical protein